MSPITADERAEILCARGAKAVVVEVPHSLPSAANLREHWAVRAKRAKVQRSLGFQLSRGADRLGLPVVVTLTRVSPRELDDDNLASAFKNWRDGVADALGLNDRDKRIAWLYEQAKGPPAVRIRIERAG